MGQQNRQRRADKQRKRRGSGQSTGTGHPSRDRPLRGEPYRGGRLDNLLEAAYHVGATGDRDGRLDALMARVDQACARLDPATLPETVAADLRAATHQVWHAGWQPADLMAAVRKRNGRDATDLLALTILDEHTARHPDTVVPRRWADQLGDVRRVIRPLNAAGCISAGDYLARQGSLRVGIVLVGTLRTCPVLPLLGPPPCSWPVEPGGATAARSSSGRPMPGGWRARDDPDPAMLSKVRALLAKAESTTFEAEATALTAKAQELMARHAIDRAVLDHDAGATDDPEGRRVLIEDPYAKQKSILLAAVAHANRSSTVAAPDLGFSTVFGFTPDLDTVELLFTSLLVQASTAMIALGAQRDARGHSRTRSFRQSFLVGFADRIGQRLAQATDDAVSRAATDHRGSMALVPLLEARDERVEETLRAAFPRVTGRTIRIAHHGGYHAGTVAAEQASLAVGDALTD